MMDCLRVAAKKMNTKIWFNQELGWLSKLCRVYFINLFKTILILVNRNYITLVMTLKALYFWKQIILLMFLYNLKIYSKIRIVLKSYIK